MRPLHFKRALGWAVLTGLLSCLPCPDVSAQQSPSRVILRPDSSRWVVGDYGGDVPASELAVGCPGYITREPDLILELESDRWVHLAVDSADGGDSTLMLRGPGGSLCNNDAHQRTLNPELISYLRAGEYYVYVGSVRPDHRGGFEMRVSEVADDDFPKVSGDRTVRLYGTSGGPIDAGERVSGCVGALAARPNHVLRLERPMWLAIHAESSSDLTLLVERADGQVLCNDDGPGSLDPYISDWFTEGVLRIYIGSHNPRVNAIYTVVVEPQQG